MSSSSAVCSRTTGTLHQQQATRQRETLLGWGDLNPAFIIVLDTTATVGQLFLIKKKKATQHPSRNTLSTTSSFIPSSCLPLCTFPAASETKGLNITVEMRSGVWILSPYPLQGLWRPLTACFFPAPQQPETRDTGMQCDSLLMTYELRLN